MAEPDHTPRLPGDLERFEVLAAGGLVWREAEGSTVEVLVVHRPRYDDWSMPKGKVDGGESLDRCALREVEEETGLRCDLGRHLTDVTYVDHQGRSKLVRYWAMTVASDGHDPDDEVDEMRWMSPAGARRLLTYEHDRALIDAFEQPAR
jgi:8-oxo-dGTP diphosphatase